MKIIALTIGMACAAWAADPGIDEARRLYDATDFQQSLGVLGTLPEKDAAVQNMMALSWTLQSLAADRKARYGKFTSLCPIYLKTAARS